MHGLDYLALALALKQNQRSDVRIYDDHPGNLKI